MGYIILPRVNRDRLRRVLGARRLKRERRALLRDRRQRLFREARAWYAVAERFDVQESLHRWLVG